MCGEEDWRDVTLSGAVRYGIEKVYERDVHHLDLLRSQEGWNYLHKDRKP